ncbi:DMT family transporter [Ferrovibrio sp.]|uniref:DMT family transporter n=1 Tax=Ferrovibrio sp. TaxID=1917215 RepID=UPI0025B870CF|nr:DMT family transporter [Ferrovibrio sp.]
MTAKSWAPIAVSAAVGVQVGLALVATRYAVNESGPATLAMFRYAIGAACLLPVMAHLRMPMRFAWRDALPIAVFGILQFGILIVLINYGLAHITAARAALLFASFPLMTMIIAAMLGREKLTLLKTAGVLLTILGVGITLGEKLFDATGAADSWVGEGAVLLAAFCGALCSVLFKPYLQRYPTLSIGAYSMLASVAFLIFLAMWEGAFTGWSGYSATGWFAVIFIGLSSGIGYFGWLWALRHAPPTQVTVFLGLSPITAGIIGALLLAEPLTWPLIAGMAVVLAGLWLALRPGKAMAPPA